MHRLALWMALGVALSPSIFELGRHWLDEPWTRYSALFVPLWLLGVRSAPGPARPRRAGAVLVAIGVLLSVVSVGGGMPRFGRPGIALSAVGMALALGTPSLPRALLVLWIVPVPTLFVSAFSGLEVATAHAAARLAQAVGVDAGLRATPEAIELVGSAGNLALAPEQGGLPLAVLLGGLGWYGAVRRGASSGSAFRACLRAAPWALLVQPIGIGCAAGLLFAGATVSARLLLDPGIWITAALVALLLTRRPALARAERPPLPEGLRG